MTKVPRKPDSRAKALAAMTKAELIKTIRQLDTRQTKLLNEIATLTGRVASMSLEPSALQLGASHVCVPTTAGNQRVEEPSALQLGAAVRYGTKFQITPDWKQDQAETSRLMPKEPQVASWVPPWEQK